MAASSRTPAMFFELTRPRPAPEVLGAPSEAPRIGLGCAEADGVDRVPAGGSDAPGRGRAGGTGGAGPEVPLATGARAGADWDTWTPEAGGRRGGGAGGPDLLGRAGAAGGRAAGGAAP